MLLEPKLNSHAICHKLHGKLFDFRIYIQYNAISTQNDRIYETIIIGKCKAKYL